MMDKKHIFSLFVALGMAGCLSAQSLEQAKTWFNNGQYAEAKPVFKKLTKQAPSNANYNFWYGACCFETGDLAEAEPYLEKSAARKVTNAYSYLGKLHFALYRFDEAVEDWEEYIAAISKKKGNTSAAETELDLARKAARMLKATENITVVDSFVVDKENFLSAYKLSKEAGTISMNEKGNGTCFVNELADKKLIAQSTKGDVTHLYSQIKLIGKWSDSEQVKGLSDWGESQNYPFLDSDGITLYFASEGEESLGGYDIFVTRYNSEDDTYLKPSNIGMPFNSCYNDYLYAIDELNNLGWFASDRYQPEGKVCIYVFVPNESKQTYDYESMDSEQVIAAATLRSIKSTWGGNSDKLLQAKERLAQAMAGSNETKKQTEFTFIVNDDAVYTSVSDFRSKEAAKLFQSLRVKEKDLSTLNSSLDELRETYRSANTDKKRSLAPGITDKENRVNSLRQEIEQLAWKVRNTEMKALKK